SSAGVFVCEQQATNAAGTANKILTITISDPPVPVITSPLTVGASVGTLFRYDIVGTNNPTSYPAPAGLPASMSLITLNNTVTSSPQLNGFVASGLINNTLPLVGKPVLMTSGPDNGQTRLISSFDMASGTIFLNSPFLP